MELEIYFSNDKTKVMVISPIGRIDETIDYVNRFKYRYDYLLIIGNGFDLSLGLPTTYRNFVESCIFKKMYVKRQQEKRKKKKIKPSLIDYLYGKKFYERWYDIEAAILEYVSRKPDGSFVNNIEEDKRDFELVSDALVEYLSNILRKLNGNDFEKMNTLPAGQLLKALYSSRSIEYSFNYTPIEDALEASGDSNKIHGEVTLKTIEKGNVKDSQIILGIDTNDLNSIAPGYSFLIKSNNSAIRSSNIVLDLLNSKEVIFFGHSLNQMDFGYFDEYFRALTTNTDKYRRLTIITKDNSSRIETLDTLRKMRIPVRDLFTHTNIKIILSDDIDEEGTDSAIHFKDLIDRIKSY